MTLDDLRKNIDRVDEVLVRLLNERARCVCEIGKLKKDGGIEIYQPDREKEVLTHVRKVAVEGPLGPEAIGRLFERIIDEARRLERRVVHGDLDDDVKAGGTHSQCGGQAGAWPQRRPSPRVTARHLVAA